MFPISVKSINYEETPIWTPFRRTPEVPKRLLIIPNGIANRLAAVIVPVGQDENNQCCID